MKISRAISFCGLMFAACGGSSSMSNATVSGGADSVDGEKWSSEAALLDRGAIEGTLQSTLLPYFYKNFEEPIFQGVGGLNLRAAKYELDPAEEAGAIVIINGRAESYIKYAELFWDLRDRGYSIYTYDHRGQGFSDRMVEDSQKGYVDQFSDYVTDMETFMDTVVKARPHKKIFVLAHSMGGAIATLYAEQRSDIDALVLTSPMHKINTAPFAESVALALAASLTDTGFGKDFAPTQKDYNPNGTNDVSHSDARHQAWHQLIAMNPNIPVGGTTNRWTKTAIEATHTLQANAALLTVPTLLLQEGADQLVVNSAQNLVCSAAKNCEIFVTPGAGHEILNETDAMRGPALDKIVSWLDAKLAP